MTSTHTTTTTNVSEKYIHDNDNSNQLLLLLTKRVQDRKRQEEEIAEKYMREIEALSEYWRLIMGRKLPPVAVRQICTQLDRGMDVNVIVDVIDQTSAAPSPSWAYASAILNRLSDQRIYTEEQYERDKMRWRLRAEGRVLERAGITDDL